MKNVIYKISNTINSNIYIGSAEKFNVRKNQHKHHLIKGTHHNKKLQNHVNKYGFNSLVFDVIESNCIDLISREQYYIDNLNPFFNICKIAYSLRGTKRTVEQKKYMIEQRLKNSGYSNMRPTQETINKVRRSRLLKGNYKQSELTKQKISKANTGKIRTDDVKQKISKSLIGKVVTEKTKNKLSIQKIGDKNPCYGKLGNLHHNYGKKWNNSDEFKKIIINISNGIFYYGVKEAAIAIGVNYKTLNGYLSGHRKNKTNLIYI